MPIFQDDFGGDRSTPPLKLTTLPNSPAERHMLSRKSSEESIRTELCEGPLPDDPEDFIAAPEEILDLPYPLNGTSNRVEFIERLKRGESPTWVPNPNVSY